MSVNRLPKSTSFVRIKFGSRSHVEKYSLCGACECFEGRIVEIRNGKAAKYGLATDGGSVIRLNPAGNFPVARLHHLLKEGRVVVAGRKVSSRSGERIFVDYVQAGFSLTSRFGLLGIRLGLAAGGQEVSVLRFARTRLSVPATGKVSSNLAPPGGAL